MPPNPLPNPQDRAERDIEELRRLFAGSGKRTRRFDEILAAAERRLASAEGDAGATAEAGPGVPPHRVRPAPDDQADDQAVEAEPVPAPAPPPASPAPAPGAGPAADRRRPVLPSGRRGLAVLLATTAVVGVVVAFAVGLRLGQAQASPEPAAGAPPAAQSSVVTGQAAATTVSTVVTAPPACLETARLGDRVIDLLVANRRGPELDRALDGYLAASQRCRRAAAPGP
jgi:hypothetical protein